MRGKIIKEQMQTSMSGTRDYQGIGVEVGEQEEKWSGNRCGSGIENNGGVASEYSPATRA